MDPTTPQQPNTSDPGTTLPTPSQPATPTAPTIPVSPRRPESGGSAPTEATISQNPEAKVEQGSASNAAAEQEPEKERELNIEKLEAQIQEAKVRGPQKVAVASDTVPASAPKTVAQPVVVLPLTESEMTDAGKKPMQFSVKWLWGWCRRQIRKFQEMLVVYKDEPKPPQA